jgi:hypothetical protein
MHSRILRTAVSGVGLAAVLAVGGCYEEMPLQPPQAQAPPATAPASTGATARPQGDITPAGSSVGALAGSKRSAENLVQQAEESSQRTADDAENP